MRQVLGALCALLMLFTPALGADKNGPIFVDGPTGPLPPQWHRSGPYLGAVIGYDAAQMRAESFKFGDAGMIGGLYAGYNLNTGAGLVLSLETDYVLTGISTKTDVGGFTVSGSNHFLASVRARVGVPVGPMLVFATAGPAFTERKAAVQAGPFVSASKDLMVGAVVGGGIDAELTRTLTLRLEALHYMFPDKAVDGGAGIFSSSDQHTTFRAGLGFRLN